MVAMSDCRTGQAEQPDRHQGVMKMLMRTDPFRELDRLNQQVFGTATQDRDRSQRTPPLRRVMTTA